jgi:hypothetical protein
MQTIFSFLSTTGTKCEIKCFCDQIHLLYEAGLKEA